MQKDRDIASLLKTEVCCGRLASDVSNAEEYTF